MENKNLIQISRSTFIADCPISTRIKHILEAYDIETINDVLRVPPHILTTFRNLGSKSIAELHEFLIKNGFHFGKEKQSNYQGMRTKFEINTNVFNGYTTEVNYEKKFKYKGWSFDKKSREIYTIIDRDIHLNVGEYIDLFGLFYVIISKRYNVDEDYMHYELKEQ